MKGLAPGEDLAHLAVHRSEGLAAEALAAIRRDECRAAEEEIRAMTQRELDTMLQAGFFPTLSIEGPPIIAATSGSSRLLQYIAESKAESIAESRGSAIGVPSKSESKRAADFDDETPLVEKRRRDEHDGKYGQNEHDEHDGKDGQGAEAHQLWKPIICLQQGCDERRRARTLLRLPEQRFLECEGPADSEPETVP
jgi:hypothetical protein